MSDTQPTGNSTTIIVARQEKSVVAAFFLTFLFGPLGLLYSSIAGGIVLTISAIILGAITFGLAAFVIWPIAIIWGVIAALYSKSSKMPQI